jgi:hypothetical protein
MYNYIAFGIIVKSEIELRSLQTFNGDECSDFITVKLGKVPSTLKNEAKVSNPFSTFNEKEFIFDVPEKFKMYVCNGKEIVLELLGNNYEEQLIYFYSNGLAATLYQRGLIPFHVSGVFLKDNEVILFAAPSRTGKSTTAVKLQEKGYPLFTDDTAILNIKDGHVYAQASYPMARLWQKSVENQGYFVGDRNLIVNYNSEYEKYGFHFHEQFNSVEQKVVAIVFLETSGDQIIIEPISKSRLVSNLGLNTYRGQWVNGMNLADTQFKLLLDIANSIKSYRAVRPLDSDTYESFTNAIINEICSKIIA